MPFPKKIIPLLSFFCITVSLWCLDHYFGLLIASVQPPNDEDSNPSDTTALLSETNISTPNWNPTTKYESGPLKPPGSTYIKTIIVPKTKNDDVDWIFSNFGEDPQIQSAIYVVDDPSAELHTPRNKGHEVLAYLSFIVEQYENLSDVNIFLHSHRFAWHNNELLSHDAVQMISRLSSERVQREGYMNLRCAWEPGCPSWMHPGTIEEDINKQEESLLARTFTELFPLSPIPHVLAQPCCAQFAISRSRIHALPLARYVFFRDWLLRTPLSDYMSGRVWEYIWQFIFTGQHVVCPEEHVCYCDGFGICFGGKEEFGEWKERSEEGKRLEEELKSWEEMRDEFERAGESERSSLEEAEAGRDLELRGRIEVLKVWGEERVEEAKRWGEVAQNRAKEAGREWKEGDGF